MKLIIRNKSENFSHNTPLDMHIKNHETIHKKEDDNDDFYVWDENDVKEE